MSRVHHNNGNNNNDKKTVLIIGGAGPTGIPIVEGLLQRQHEVTMLHTGNHKPTQAWYHDGSIKKIICNPFDMNSFEPAIPANQQWDCAIVMYGRLREIAKVLRTHVKNHFISIGGIPVYRGFAYPELLSPPGLPVPQYEDSDKGTDDRTLFGIPDHPNPKVNSIVKTERIVFELYPDKATHFRYPFVSKTIILYENVYIYNTYIIYIYIVSFQVQIYYSYILLLFGDKKY